MKTQRFSLLLALSLFSVVLSTAQTTKQSAQGFQMPKNMYASHGGRSVADIGLDQKEISDLLSIVLATGLDEEGMRSAAALRKELLARRVDLGEGADKGLVLQGSGELCGGTGNCATWFFRKVGTNWRLLGPKNYAPIAAAFGFLALKHNSLYDLVIANHESEGSETIEVWQFNGTVYESKECYRQEGSGLFVTGDCQ